MKSLTKNKPVMIALLIFAAVIVAYNFFFAGSASSVATQSASAEQVGNDVVALNASLQSVTFDTSIFASPLYASLHDFTPVIAPQPIGRANPFAPPGQ